MFGPCRHNDIVFSMVQSLCQLRIFSHTVKFCVASMYKCNPGVGFM